MQLKTPLDFLAVTEHAEFLGALESFVDPAHPLYDHPELGQLLRSPESDDRMQGWFALLEAMRGDAGLEGYDETALKRAVWTAIIDAADRHYQPGEFTTFAAYEWTAYIEGGNMHRNVIFNGTKNLPLPFTSRDSIYPEDLWGFLERMRRSGVEAIAIPHNSNVSDGRMFTLADSKGNGINEAYADRRTHHEPVVEITQNKGTSETHPKLSPDDPFAGHEIFGNTLAGYGNVGKLEVSYVREALALGMHAERTRGFNPLEFGFVGSTDSHSALSIIEEDSVVGFGGPTYDSTPESRWGREAWNGLPYWALSASGVTGVWSETNTRDAIFAALRRRETYATTGPRIRVRAFADWHLQSDFLDKPDLERLVAGTAVPMGSLLQGLPAERSPRIAVWAVKDPTGANLDRVQVIKGWSDGHGPRVKIFDVAWSGDRKVNDGGVLAPVGSTVDVKSASYSNDIGAAELKTVWTDPEFDPSTPAYYYIRVIEIPTPRWSTFDAKALGKAVPAGQPISIQERAFTSPFWYYPEG